eukprot:TRINITY_DN4326_c0_g1_i1.p1 TRINITY_DN4326_c0_g1~~TRINITY_DN4326_c0_g1_i1.p1  ORF type:complete len:322 (-),score=67.99 TRINITY_DN4326_c0_g1_i1:326-1291(-)
MEGGVNVAKRSFVNTHRFLDLPKGDSGRYGKKRFRAQNTHTSDGEDFISLETKEKRRSKGEKKNNNVKRENTIDEQQPKVPLGRREFNRLLFDLKPHFGPSKPKIPHDILPPWCPSDARYLFDDVLPDRMKSIGAELNHFCKYIELKPKELQERVQLADRVREIASNIWPNSQVEIFGSVAYNLCLPSSDVDLMLMNCEMTPEQSLMLFTPLDILYDALDGEDWIREKRKINATVPLIKIETTDNVNIDIIYGSKLVSNTLNVKQFTRRYHFMRPLVIFLKQLLTQHGLNTPFSGGIGSYGLVFDGYECVSAFLCNSKRTL